MTRTLLYSFSQNIELISLESFLYYKLLKTSFASVIISAFWYMQEKGILQILTLFLFYTLIYNTYRCGLACGVDVID